MSEEGAAPPVPSFPEKCNIKDAKTVLLKMIVDAENDGEMKAELPLLQKWLEDQHADEVRHGKMRCARRDAASLHMASIPRARVTRYGSTHRPSETGPAPLPPPLPPPLCQTLAFALGIRKCAKDAGLELTENTIGDPAEGAAPDLEPFKALHTQFLAPGAPQEVTISQKNMKKFNEALEKGTLSLLSGAFSDMIAQLSKELMPKFMSFRHEAQAAAASS